MTPGEQEALDTIRAAMTGHGWRVQSVVTMRGLALQVYARVGVTNRYEKAGPLLFPPDGGTVADTLGMLGALATDPTVELEGVDP